MSAEEKHPVHTSTFIRLYITLSSSKLDLVKKPHERHTHTHAATEWTVKPLVWPDWKHRVYLCCWPHDVQT